MVRAKGHKILHRLFILMVLALVTVVSLALFRMGAPPAIRIESDLPGIGKRTPVMVTLEEPGRGLGEFKVEFVQGGRVQTLAEREHQPREFWAFWGPRTKTDSLTLEVGRETVEGLREGEGTIRVSAKRASTWLRYPDQVVVEKTFPVHLIPPSLQVLSTAVHAAQGGCEVVIYRVGERSVRDGVQAGEWWFPGSPLPGGGEGDRFALFSVPYDLEDATGVRLVASDDVLNEARANFINRFFKKPVKTDSIRVTDPFMEKVVPSILSMTPQLSDRGDLLQNYLSINGELRLENARTLKELAEESAEAFLWKRPFLQMPNTKVMSAFADRRTYLYENREVDQQDHLGYDLASTRQAPVPAANDGIVVLARFLGIYGNAVVVDHGYGLMSLYGHLSSIEVEEGQDIGRGESVGRTGDTGLAGGDHLHFTMLLHGLPVNPVEWWDGRWIRHRIAGKLGDVLGFQE